jgi:hypothetical protein
MPPAISAGQASNPVKILVAYLIQCEVRRDLNNRVTPLSLKEPLFHLAKLKVNRSDRLLFL